MTVCGLPLWYFYSKTTPMDKKLEAIFKQIDLLSLEQQKELLRILQLMLAASQAETSASPAAPAENSPE